MALLEILFILSYQFLTVSYKDCTNCSLRNMDCNLLFKYLKELLFFRFIRGPADLCLTV
jgi:hypothetical protein